MQKEGPCPPEPFRMYCAWSGHATQKTLMIIKKIYTICKAFSKINSINEEKIYEDEAAGPLCQLPPCPSCGGPSYNYCRDGAYTRHFVTFQNGTVMDRRLKVRCVKCTSCLHSHAVLPAVIIPYSSYSPCFLISLLYSYYTHRFPDIESLCSFFRISSKTLYRIIRAFVSDCHFLRTIKKILPCLPDTLDIRSIYSLVQEELLELLYVFYVSSGHGFLQPMVRLRPKIRRSPTDRHSIR